MSRISIHLTAASADNCINQGRRKLGCGVEAEAVPSRPMGSWNVRAIDPHDEGLLREAWELGKIVDELGRPWSFYWAWETARAQLIQDDPQLERALLGAYDSAELLGTAALELTLLDNLHAAYVEVGVLPERRRKRVGATLHKAALDFATGRGRRLLITEVPTPVDGPPSPGVRFAEAMGYTTAQVNEEKLVDLFATERTWAALAEEVAPHHAGYRFVSWTNVLLDELMDGYCALNESFYEEAPIGDLAVEREVWDARRVRDREALARKTGRNTVGTAAVAPGGSFAGFTEIVIRDASPQRGIQSGTLVPRPHRGHRLGLAMKLVNHARVREQFPLCQRLITGNAGVNLHMNAVNERLGYQVVEHMLDMQLKV
jgi:GNAT superfamily N-acetyltransferase